MKVDKIAFVAEYRQKGIIDFCDMRENSWFYTESENCTNNAVKALKKYFNFSFKKETDMFVSVYYMDQEAKTERAYCIFTNYKSLPAGTINVCICDEYGNCNTDRATAYSPAILYKRLTSIFEAVQAH